jgi:Tol biopolymer transport system component
MNADGSGLRKLTDYQAKPSFAFSDRRLQWSPDGKRILFSQSDAVANYTDLFTVDVATGKTTNLTNSPGVFDSDFSWSPDGKKIAFTSGNLTTDYGLFVFGVYVMDADGSKMVKLGDSLTQPSWSADGKQLMAISRPNRDFWAIVTLSLQGTVTNTLMQTGGNKYQMVRYPIWLAR